MYETDFRFDMFSADFDFSDKNDLMYSVLIFNFAKRNFKARILYRNTPPSPAEIGSEYYTLTESDFQRNFAGVKIPKEHRAILWALKDVGMAYTGYFASFSTNFYQPLFSRDNAQKAKQSVKQHLTQK